MSFKQLFEDEIAGEVYDDGQTLANYSTDASIFEVTPDCVVYPDGLEDLQKIVSRVVELKRAGTDISITPRAAGTCMSGGSLTQGIMLDMTKHFGGTGEIDHENKRISVGSGAYYRDIEQVCSAAGLLFPPYTSSKDVCAIGGMIGNNASGEKSLRYGATTNWTRTVYMVLDDGHEYEFGPLDQDQLAAKLELSGREGEIYRGIVDLLDNNWDQLQEARPKVRKNAAGYGLWRIWNQDKTEFNLAKLIVGSQGTLGVITGATLNLVPEPKVTRMIVIAIENLTHLAEAISLVLAAQPEGLEVYDRHTYDLAKIYIPEDAARAAIAEGKEMVLFAQFADHTEDQTNHNAKICQSSLQKKGFKVKYVDTTEEAESHWKIRRASYKMLKEHAHGDMRVVPCLEDTVVNIVHFGEFVASLETILADYDVPYAFHGHIGDGSIRPFPLFDMTREDTPRHIFELSRRVYDLAFAFGGSMSVDHNDGLIRTPFIESMYGSDVVRLFEQTKAIFDPLGIFNPGKKVHGDLHYSMAHVSRSNTSAPIGRS